MREKMFEQLERINERPESLEFYTASDLWTDEQTSSRMLSFHLDETNRCFFEKRGVYRRQRNGN